MLLKRCSFRYSCSCSRGCSCIATLTSCPVQKRAKKAMFSRKKLSCRFDSKGIIDRKNKVLKRIHAHQCRNPSGGPTILRNIATTSVTNDRRIVHLDIRVKGPTSVGITTKTIICRLMNVDSILIISKDKQCYPQNTEIFNIYLVNSTQWS